MVVVWLVGSAVDDATHGGAHSVLTHLLGLALAIAVVDRADAVVQAWRDLRRAVDLTRGGT